MNKFLKIIKPQLFYLAILAFGVSLGFTFQLSNLSSIFRFLGASNDSLPLLWLVPPLTGLIVQPLIGQISDDTISKYGKRRPYIFAWSLLAGLAFLVLPFTSSLAIAIIMIWIIDCSLNGCQEALRALTGDITTSEQERSRAFAIQAFFAGIGGAIGTSLPYISFKMFDFMQIKHPIVAGHLPLNLRTSFAISSIVLLVALFFMMRKVKERAYTHASLLQKRRRKVSIWNRFTKIARDLFYSVKKMPDKFKKICLIHGMTWMGIFIFWLYFTITLAQNIYHLPRSADPAVNHHFAVLLQKASLDSSLYFTIYQYVSLAYAVVLFLLSDSRHIKRLHAISLIIGGISLAMISFEHSAYALIASFVGIGIMWGSLLILPYAIVLQILPKGKLGTYLGIFNVSITAPQIVCGLLLPTIYRYVFHGYASYLILIAGVLIMMSGYLWLRLAAQTGWTKSASADTTATASIS